MSPNYFDVRDVSHPGYTPLVKFTYSIEDVINSFVEHDGVSEKG